jgi:hypothetical protein
MAASIDASHNVMEYTWQVAIKINGIPVSKITGGQSQAVLLFLAEDARIKTFPAQRQKSMQPLFCLTERENTIEISYKEKGQPVMPSPFTGTTEAENYQVSGVKFVRTRGSRRSMRKGLLRFMPSNRRALPPSSPNSRNTLLFQR